MELSANEGSSSWVEKGLGDLASFRTGPFGSSLHKSDYVDGGIPLVNPMHIVDGRIVPTRSMAVSPATAERLADFALRRDDIVLGRRGEMGRCAVVSEREDGWLCGTGSLIVRPNEGVSADFLQRVLASPQVVALIEGASVGSTMVNLNQGILRSVRILAPSPAEQRAIAEALSDVDALIAALDALIPKKRAIKTAAMQQLLTGRTRLPGFSGEWETVTFRDVVRRQSGDSSLIKGKLSSSPSADLYKAFSASGQDVWRSGFNHEGPAIVVSAVGSRCGKSFRADGKWSAIANTHIVWSKPGMTSLDFLMLYLNDEDFWVKGGSGQPFVQFKRSFERSLALPGLGEQEAITAILSDMDAEIAALEARRGKTAAIKTGMMQELLTGRTRLVPSAS